MPAKIVREIRLSLKDAEAVNMALVAYAEAAYPTGGSECSQASNQALKALGEAFLVSNTVPLKIKKRQLAMIKAAIRWFYSTEANEGGENDIDSEELLRQIAES